MNSDYLVSERTLSKLLHDSLMLEALESGKSINDYAKELGYNKKIHGEVSAFYWDKVFEDLEERFEKY